MCGTVDLDHAALNESVHSKWFEPRSISSFSRVIIRVSVVLKRTEAEEKKVTTVLSKAFTSLKELVQ